MRRGHVSTPEARVGKGGDPVRRLVIVGLVALAALGAVAVLAGCESADNAAARRANAQTELVRAQAAADSERAANREAARQAGHERMMETLPFLAVIVGGLLLAGMGGLAFWDLRSQRQTQGGTDAAILLELRRLEMAQAERDRAMWRALAQVSRRRLTDGKGEVIIYTDKER